MELKAPHAAGKPVQLTLAELSAVRLALEFSLRTLREQEIFCGGKVVSYLRDMGSALDKLEGLCCSCELASPD